jgi:hypothetical protein
MARRSPAGGARMPGWLVSRQPAGRNNWSSAASASCRQDHQASAGHDPVGRSHRAAAVGAALVDPKRGLKGATRLDLPLGHIGMVVSGRARELCWTPLIDWLKAR